MDQEIEFFRETPIFDIQRNFIAYEFLFDDFCLVHIKW